MKKLFLMLFISTSFLIAKSQDIIVTKKGDEIRTKIIEVGATAIEYNLFANGDTIFEIQKTDVFEIKYENGKKEIFLAQLQADPCSQGKTDAEQHYDGGRGAATGTFLTTIIGGGLAGLIPAIATSSTKPKDKNLNYPYPELMNNQDYAICYRNQAHKHKSKKVWTAWIEGFAIDVVVAAIVLSAR